MEYLKLGAILLALDAVYLMLVGNRFKTMIESIQKSSMKLRYGSIAACYVLILFGLKHLIVDHKRPTTDAFVLGLVIYGVFDTVNYAIFEKWDLHIAMIDAVWGGVLFSLTTYIYRLLQ